MKLSLTLLYIFFSLLSSAQQRDTTAQKLFQPEETVTFVTVVNAKYAGKDSIIINGYVVHLNYDQIKKLHGKKIRLTGKVLAEGMPVDQEEDMQKPYQGSWHIASPKIEIVDQKTPTTAETAIVTGIIDAGNATKDGIYFNRYVVNLGYNQIQKLHGKKIRVTGKVTTEEGLSNSPSSPIRQGRDNDTRHIENPKVELL